MTALGAATVDRVVGSLGYVLTRNGQRMTGDELARELPDELVPPRGEVYLTRELADDAARFIRVRILADPRMRF